MALDEDTKNSLERMQNFDIQTLPREKPLGDKFNFNDALIPAERLVSLYKRLSISVLDDLPVSRLNQIRNKANEDFSRFEQILNFDPTQSNAVANHTQLINDLNNSYDATFEQLFQLISYSMYKTTDFQRLEGEAHSTLQSIKDEASKITKSLQKDKEASQQLLEEIRKIAAEQGVTQQAIYFKQAADDHEAQANAWKMATIWVSVGLGLYAIASIFIHKIPWLDPTNTYQAAQLAISKVLVFGVISFMLYLCAKNFISHKHNAIINRHRQNALLTYTALVEAAGDTPNREVILVQAAACIFSPQGTGYTSESIPPPPGAQSVIEFFTRQAPKP
jgi:hypothetical protein